MTSPQSTLAAAYVHAVNTHNAAAFHALFAPGAVVDDAGRRFEGLDAIKAWSNSDIFDADVTFDVIEQTSHDDHVLLTTQVDGNFDRTGLPDPVIISHRIQTVAGGITGVTCRLVTS